MAEESRTPFKDQIRQFTDTLQPSIAAEAIGALRACASLDDVVALDGTQHGVCVITATNYPGRATQPDIAGQDRTVTVLVIWAPREDRQPRYKAEGKLSGPHEPRQLL